MVNERDYNNNNRVPGAGGGGLNERAVPAISGDTLRSGRKGDNINVDGIILSMLFCYRYTNVFTITMYYNYN